MIASFSILLEDYIIDRSKSKQTKCKSCFLRTKPLYSLQNLNSSFWNRS